MNRINYIMNHASMTHCKGCGKSYIPMGGNSEEYCPITDSNGIRCNYDHYKDVRELMNDAEHIDEYDADSLGLTGFFDPVEVV